MEENFKKFYKSLDKNSFKYFIKEGNYYVYEDDLRFIRGCKSSCRIEEHLLENAIREALTLHKVKVEEYEDCVLRKEGYPGNWKDFTDIMLDKDMPPSICSVSLEGTMCSLAFLNTLDNTIYTSLFEDDDIYSNLCGFISEINAFELIYSNKTLEPLVLSLGIVTHKTQETRALEGLISFLKIDSPTVKEYIRPDICRVDKKALESINMWRVGERSVVDTFTCHTVQGHRLLLHFTLYPLKCKEEIEYRHLIVESLRDVDLSLLKHFPDLLRVTKRIQNYKITIQEIVRLYQVIGKIPTLLERIKRKELRKDFYSPLENLDTSLQEVKKRVEEAVDLEATNRNVYRLKIEEEGLRVCYQTVQDKIKEEYHRILEISDKVKYEEASNLFKITRNEYRLVEDAFKRHNILILNVLKTGVHFTTKTLSELNTERESVLEKIRKEERRALETLKGFIREKCSEIEVLNYLVALLDVFNSFSLKANSPGYSKPSFIEEDKTKDNNKNVQIILKDLFHPLLEDNSYIPNDLEMNKEKMLIITGPNMGGKSTFLKSVAVISVMAQMGCHVPSSYARLPIYDGIYVRMGASDCTYTGDSTFMMEMKDISKIVRSSTNSSLILIDELGRGTSEVDGLSLALAIRDYLLRLQCITLFATHFPELCESGGVLKKRVLSDGTLLLYKLGDGVCDESFGINVAKKVGFPQDVIDAIIKDLQ